MHVELYYSENYSNDNSTSVRARLDDRQAEIGSSIVAFSPRSRGVKIILYNVTP